MSIVQAALMMIINWLLIDSNNMFIVQGTILLFLLCLFSKAEVSHSFSLNCMTTVCLQQTVGAFKSFPRLGNEPGTLRFPFIYSHSSSAPECVFVSITQPGIVSKMAAWHFIYRHLVYQWHFVERSQLVPHSHNAQHSGLICEIQPKHKCLSSDNQRDYLFVAFSTHSMMVLSQKLSIMALFRHSA